MGYALARAAYRQAAKLSPFGADIVGVGCAAALATDREKAGEHKAFVATYSGTQERRWWRRWAFMQALKLPFMPACCP